MLNTENIKHKVSHSISIKLLVIAFLLLLLQILLSFVRGIIHERQQMQYQAQSQITQRWGGTQQIGAPLLDVSYRRSELVKQKKISSTYHNHIMPKDFQVDIQLEADTRYLGIYEVPVFVSSVSLQGSIEIDPQRYIGENEGWSIEHMFIPISEMRGLRSIDELIVNGQPQELSHEQNTVAGMTGITIDLKHFKQQPLLNFSIQLVLAGSQQFDVLPLAGQTSVQMRSNWNAPSFVGDFLPQHRSISAAGFSAKWQVNELNHNMGRVIKGASSHFNQNNPPTLGSRIIIPANIYQVNERTVKYGSLIMLLSFAGFFLAELFFKLRLHPFQYLLIGFSLSVFYLLLLSISEYLSFGIAFLIAACSIIGLISGYCSVVLKHKKRGLYTGILFSLLYGFIYVLVRAEQLSLLMGTLGIWVFLALVMYLTRKINWYEINSKTEHTPSS